MPQAVVRTDSCKEPLSFIFAISIQLVYARLKVLLQYIFKKFLSLLAKRIPNPFTKNVVKKTMDW